MNRKFKTLGATSAAICYSGGVFKSIQGYNPVAAVSYLQLFDALALPADTAVPLWVSRPIPASIGYEFNLDEPVPFATGLFACLSSTAATKTLVATNSNFVGFIDTQEPEGLTTGGAQDATASGIVEIWTGKSVENSLYRMQVVMTAVTGTLKVTDGDGNVKFTAAMPIGTKEWCFGSQPLRIGAECNIGIYDAEGNTIADDVTSIQAWYFDVT
jgi:hypothetical protein